MTTAELRRGIRRAERRRQRAIRLARRLRRRLRRLDLPQWYRRRLERRYGRAVARRRRSWRKKVRLESILRQRRQRRAKRRDKIGQFFCLREFNCRDGTRVPSYMREPLRKWASKIGDPMRRRFGTITVYSGYRTPSYNASVGGVPGSYHIYTDRRASPAVDFGCARGTPQQWGAYARLLLGQTGGVGIYPSQRFTHADTRPYRQDWWG